MAANLRMLLRLLLALAFTLLCMPVQAVLCLRPGLAKVRFAQTYWLGMAFILGVHIKVKGNVCAMRPVVFIANHCSWVDIIVLGAVLPGCFVAKGEIAKWPFVSWVAKLGRTIFVSRSKATLERERGGLTARLAAGDNIILFPEGTTSDGLRILPFQSAFLAIAQAPCNPAVQPVTIVYDQLDGLPVQRWDRPLISWYGDMDMASHYPGIARRKSLGATIIIDPAIPAGTFPNRKALSAALAQRLATNAARLRQGQPVEPKILVP